MKPVETFAVVIRTVGLIVSLVASAILFFAFLNLVLGGPANAVGMIIVVGPILLVGRWLLRGAPPLLDYAFPIEDRHERMPATQPSEHVIPDAEQSL